jgi:hypothetical protein
MPLDLGAGARREGPMAVSLRLKENGDAADAASGRQPARTGAPTGNG